MNETATVIAVTKNSITVDRPVAPGHNGALNIGNHNFRAGDVVEVDNETLQVVGCIKTASAPDDRRRARQPVSEADL